ncbi:hypothetical protein WJX81_005845 [Elliptochloris bilobata]|uniref:RmlD-like substrate binding domain-containing protein n=1 Tax=Elliptochloris bilobata TaxID=381761 RepID=A0AAW1RTS8_9CHLO
MEQRRTILITGGSGYLGQFLVEDIAAAGYRVGFTHFSSAAPRLAGGSAAAFEVDLATGAGLAECLDALGPLLAVVNCAAVSSLAICERDPAAARAVNVPHKLLDSLKRHAAASGARPLLIQLSSDQVYAGTKAYWTEDDACEPVNAYGRTKLEAERVIHRRWPEHCILRSSIIYGPLSPTPVPRMLFLQFIDRALCEQKPTTFFEDEYRCAVWVNDIKDIVRTLVSGTQEPLQHRVLNMGGPARLSRDVEAEREPGGAEEPVHVDRPRHRPRDHAGDLESARNFYARQLMQPEWLIDIPSDLATHWYALPRPEGKRCLVVAAVGRTDLMCWKGYALYDCSAEFRLFWLHTKLAECGAGAARGPRHRYPFAPLTAYACDSGGLHAALHGSVPFVRDGVTLLHKEGYYELGASPLALLWKDAACSRYHLDTDAAGIVPERQVATLQCLPCGAIGTGDEPPHVLGRLPDAAAQQLGDRARPGRLLRFSVASGGLQLGPDGCPLSAHLHYEGPANQRRGKADSLSKVHFQYRARRQPATTLELLLAHHTGGTHLSLEQSQGGCEEVHFVEPADSMVCDAQ